MALIIDLHCDLLSYLAQDSRRTPFDCIARCAFPQLQAGGVAQQTLAIYTETAPGSAQKGWKQVEIFSTLSSDHTRFIPAVENSSGFCEENEPLETGLRRLHALIQKIGRPLYISLTWNGENRFGGGAGSKAGLKSDGLELLKWLAHEQIALDFSHASDRLSDDLFNALEKYGLNLPVLASHSNFRAILDHERNLPDAIAKEIFRRKGLVGLVFYKKFVHPTDPLFLLKHIEHGLALGGADALCFGADFFCVDDPINAEVAGFFETLSDSSAYPYLLGQMRAHFPEEQIQKIASGNYDVFQERSLHSRL